MTRSLDTLASRLQVARKHLGMTQEQLAAASGLKQPDISKIEKGLIQQTTGIARLASALRVPVLWLEIGDDPGPDWTSPAPTGGETSMAHSVSLRPATMRRRITWEQIMTGADLGDEFEAVMEDDSMPERAPRGHIVVWRTDKRPEFGKLVLARDTHGRLHVRRKMQAATPSGWCGAPENPSYAAFDGDLLTIIAVARGVLEPT